MRKYLLPLIVCVFGFAFGMAQEDNYSSSAWWAPGEARTFPNSGLSYKNGHGELETLLTGEALDIQDHAFFRAMGPAGRGCVTCHQPANGMSLSITTIQQRWDETQGKDPLFAAYDGSNCPALPQGERDSHSLLLDHGLIRVERPWPPQPFHGEDVKPDFRIEIVRDPYGCNSGPNYGPEAGIISVYRRVRPAANLKYLLAAGFAYDPKQGLPLPSDEETGAFISGNLMADARASTLFEQMRDAATTHLELASPLSERDETEIEAFLLRVYTAQSRHVSGASLNAYGAEGGPEKLAVSKPGALSTRGTPVWSEFAAWESISAAQRQQMGEQEYAFRTSVARGARIFREKMFLITDSAGINSPVGFGNPVRYSCVFCHNMSQMGNDVAPGQINLGTTVLPFADPAPHLPLFRITCLKEPHPHHGKEILTTDPGYALTTGKCADVGKITLQSLRGLSARPPYFANGSAKTLRDVIDYYDRRYNIGYTEQEKRDLVNLMSAL